jgi:uncharacterized protein (TIGR02391 family)
MTVEIALSLEPEELAAHILIALNQRVQPFNVENRLSPDADYEEVMASLLGGASTEELNRHDLIRAFREAWAWLEVQGLLVPARRGWGQSDGHHLSRRAHRFTSPSDFVPFRVARWLDRDMLNERIREDVWGAFIRGHFDVAAGIAMQSIEAAVRDAAGLPIEMYGKPLLAKAFDPQSGPLTDSSLPISEREGVRDLFVGAFAAHRNPRAHGRITTHDAAEVVEVVMLANHLLRLVDRASAARGAKA